MVDVEINSADIVFFSPTDTTKQVVLEVARGTGAENLKLIDLTVEAVRKQDKFELNSNIVIIGVPVYGARIYKPLRKVFTRMDLNNKLVILVSLYGNVSCGFAHYELTAICNRQGAKVIGIGHFVGEHTYSTTEIPIAMHRPNKKDLYEAFRYGEMIRRKLDGVTFFESTVVDKVKNRYFCSFVYHFCSLVPKQHGRYFVKAPIVDRNLCIQCGLCVKECPMQVIASGTYDIMENKCIRCLACAKKCPIHARKVNVTINAVKIGLKNMSKNNHKSVFYI